MTRSDAGQGLSGHWGHFGIGRATARALAMKGATVVLVGRDPSKGERTAEEIRITVTEAASPS